MKSTRTDFTSRLVLGAAFSLVFGLAGCTSNSINIGDGGADGSRGDGGIACGTATCTGGQVCCNASCGICAAPGEGCIAIACEDAGGPSDCGSETCGAGELCCTGCNPGEEFCSTVGCPDLACPPPSVCGGVTCETSDACCAGCCGEELCAGPGGACPGLDCSLVDCPPPPTCGDGAGCGAGDICCDNPCNGTTFCTAGGAGCPVFDCPPPPVCGSTECAPGEFCCSDCDGAQFCSAGGCPATPCPPPSCGTETCTGTQICCISASGAESCMPGPTCPGDPPPDTSCGGFVGATCGRAQYCDYPAGAVSCGAADGTGTCTARPDACSRIYDPVCGCDGRDYSNECIAHLNGTDVASFGTCATPADDCRTTGCAAGSSCYVCGPPGTGFSCVPDGTVCPL